MTCMVCGGGALLQSAEGLCGKCRKNFGVPSEVGPCGGSGIPAAMNVVAELEALVEAGKGDRSHIYLVAEESLAYIRRLQTAVVEMSMVEGPAVRRLREYVENRRSGAEPIIVGGDS